ncbi:hypothetical protein NFJ02_41g107180 [Pycnococcus provasolii]
MIRLNPAIGQNPSVQYSTNFKVVLDNDSLASYTITGWTRNTTLLTVFSARGDTIEFAASDGKMVVRSSDGTVLAGDNKNTPTCRRLQSFAGSLMTSGSFTMMAALSLS